MWLSRHVFLCTWDCEVWFVAGPFGIFSPGEAYSFEDASFIAENI